MGSSDIRLPAGGPRRRLTVHDLIGEPVGGRWTKARKARTVTSRVTAAQELAHALDAMPAGWFSASFFAVFPGRRDVVYDEKTSTTPVSFIQATLRAWENAALSAASGAGKVTIIRFGMSARPTAIRRKRRASSIAALVSSRAMAGRSPLSISRMLSP